MSAALLQADGVVKSFAQRRTLGEALRRSSPEVVPAVDTVSLTVRRGEIAGLAGGSGSGKTTLARCLIRLVEPDAGCVRLDGADVLAAGRTELRELRRRMQMIFQDPYASLNPRMDVGDAILEAGTVHRRPGHEDASVFVGRALDRVHLTQTVARRKPRELSGGQRQRVAIARALAVDPELLIADEAVSALDVSVQAQLLNLFVDLRDQLGVGILFVSHQLAVLAEVADTVTVMERGRVVESGPATRVFGSPRHEYTRALLAAHPRGGVVAPGAV